MLFRFGQHFFKNPPEISNIEEDSTVIASRVYAPDITPLYFYNWDNEPVKNLSQKEQFNFFLQTDHFKHLKLQLNILFKYLKDWCEQQNITTSGNNGSYNVWDKFFSRLTNNNSEASEIYSKSRVLLFNEGKAYLEYIVNNLQNSKDTPLEKQVRLMKNFLKDERLEYCFAGAYTGITSFYMDLPTKDWQQQAAAIRYYVINQVATIIVTQHFDYYPGNEIHMTNALTNYVSDKFGIRTIQDPNIPTQLPVSNPHIVLAYFSENIELNISFNFLEKLSQTITEELLNITTYDNAMLYIAKMDEVYLDENLILGSIFEFTDEKNNNYKDIKNILKHAQLFNYILHSMIYRLYKNSSLCEDSLYIIPIEGSDIYFIPEKVQWSFVESTELSTRFHFDRQGLDKYLSDFNIVPFYKLILRTIDYSDNLPLFINLIEFIENKVADKSLLTRLINISERYIKTCVNPILHYFAHGIFTAKLFYIEKLNQKTILNPHLKYKSRHINKALQIAVKHNSNLVDLLLIIGANPYAHSYSNKEFQDSSIHYAAGNNNIDMLYRLVPNYMEMLPIDKNAKSPMYLAAKLGHWEFFIQLAYKTRGNMMMKSEISKILLIAAKNNHGDIARALITHGIDVNYIYKKAPYIGFSALNFAILNNDYKLVLELLKYQAITNVKFFHNKKLSLHNLSIPPILTAVKNSVISPSIVRTLLNYGARLDITDNNGLTPAEILAIKKDWKVLKILIYSQKNSINDNANFSMCINYAVLNNKINMVKLLIKNGRASPNKICLTKNNKYLYPLHIAIKFNYLDIARVLLEYGAKSELRFDDTSKTPMDIALKFNNLAAVKLLIEFGYKNDIILAGEKTAINIASEQQHWEIVKTLALGENTELDSADFRSALIKAAELNETEVIECLLNGGTKASYFKSITPSIKSLSGELFFKFSQALSLEAPPRPWYECNKSQTALNIAYDLAVSRKNNVVVALIEGKIKPAIDKKLEIC